MAKQTSPQHRAEPNEATLEFWRFEANMQRLHGVKPLILPGFGKHRAASIMAATETEAEAA